jgi:DNA-binding protein Alba
MHNYKKVVPNKDDIKNKEENRKRDEIRVTTKGSLHFLLSIATNILNDAETKVLTIKATGNAIVKAVNLTEIVKRRVGDLHQINKIHHIEIEEVYEPLMEGLDKIV